MRLHLGISKVALATSFVLGFASFQIASAQVPVDLNTWSQKGPAGNGTWTVSPDGSNVLQTINGNPTFFVSPNQYFNTTVQGSFGVETNSDDDYIGFVFGYNAPQGTGLDYDFLLFDWKQLNQSGSTAGFTLSRVNGTDVNLFSNHQTSQTDYTVLDSDVGAGRGWADNVVYDFTLNYTSDHITIGIDGGAFNDETIFDVGLNDVDPSGTIFGGAFPTGQFGFYNYSQAHVRYQSFTQADDPVLVTDPANGETLTFPNARVGGTASMASLEVSNAGGIGSELTGNVGAVSGIFAGPGGSFTLGEAESTNYDFTFTPPSRGTFSSSVLVDADAPSLDSTVAFSGTGVGPVTQITGDDMGTFDFGSIDQNDTATLPLELANVTTDMDVLSLVGLTVDYEIVGTDADKFSLAMLGGEVFDAGESDSFDMVFDPAGEVGSFSATLLIYTDEGAPFGSLTGASFEYSLVGMSTAIPEPTTLVGLASLAGLSLARRRR